MSEQALSRRQFCGFGLVAPVAGFGGRRPKNRRAHHKDTRLYHGPIRVPVDVCEMASRGRVVQTTASHMAVRVSHLGTVYLFRVVGGRDYLGEVVETQSGTIRVHLWAIVEAVGRPVEDFLGQPSVSVAPASPA
jgi:hypothetical protein